MQRGAAGLILLIACGGGSNEPVAVPPPALPADAAPGPEPDAAAAAHDAGPTLSEAQARALLAARFRGAGLRIRQDVRVGGATLDGADPQARVGYEYVAEGDVASFGGADGWKVLIVEATDLAQLTARADAFLSELRSESGQ